jgi:hypothetical protein
MLNRSGGHRFEDGFCARCGMARKQWDATGKRCPRPSPMREQTIRLAWDERGAKEWNPKIHGNGLAPLHIQTPTRMMPARRGRPMPANDILEFRMERTIINGRPIKAVVCEGVIVAVFPISDA